VIANKIEILHKVDQWVRRLLHIQSKLELVEMQVDDLVQKLVRSMEEKISDRFLELETFKAKLWRHSPQTVLSGYRHRVHSQLQKIISLSTTFSEKRNWQIDHLATKLKLLNPRVIMERGYSIVRLLSSNQVVKKASDVRMGDKLLIELSKGRITAKV